MSDCQKFLEEYVEWQTKAMPLCTKESQFLKVEEELEEFLESNSIEELVDVVMASIILGVRFNSPVAFFIVDKLFEQTFDDEELLDKFIEKFEINKKRTWVFNERTKTYHHEITWEELVEWTKDFCQKNELEFEVMPHNAGFYIDDYGFLDDGDVYQAYETIMNRAKFVEIKDWIKSVFGGE